MEFDSRNQMINLEKYESEVQHITDDGKLFALVGGLDTEYNVVSDFCLTTEEAARVAVVYCLSDCLVYGVAAIESASAYREVMRSLSQSGGDIYGRKIQQRGASRRHFRGDMARYVVNGLLSSYGDGIDVLMAGYGSRMQVTMGREVVESLTQIPSFGAMTALKFVDIICHATGTKLKWSADEDDWVVDNKPKKYLDQLKIWSGKSNVLSRLCKVFQEVDMNTKGGLCDLPEVETIICRTFDTRRTSVQSGRLWIGGTVADMTKQFSGMRGMMQDKYVDSALATTSRLQSKLTLDVLGSYHFSRLNNGVAE